MKTRPAPSLFWRRSPPLTIRICRGARNFPNVRLKKRMNPKWSHGLTFIWEEFLILEANREAAVGHCKAAVIASSTLPASQGGSGTWVSETV